MNYVFYHKVDLDGFVSGGLTRYYLEVIKNQPVEMIPINYTDSIDWSVFTPGDNLYMVDFHIPPEYFSKLDELDITIIDHHESFLKNLGNKKLKKGIISIGEAACSLVWKYFYDEDVPKAVQLWSKYDVWDKDEYWESETLPFQYGSRTLELDPSLYFNTWRYLISHKQLDDKKWVNELIKIGKSIIKYEYQENLKNLQSYGFDAEFQGMRALCLNTASKGSQLFEPLWDENKYDIMFKFVNLGGRYEITLYTTKDIDVSEIAKKYGGGGHVNAAGFIVNDIKINNNKIEVII